MAFRFAGTGSKVDNERGERQPTARAVGQPRPYCQFRTRRA